MSVIYIRDGKRFNIHAQGEIDGVRYPHFLDESLHESLGITKVSEPVAPADFSYESHTRNEIDESPFVIYTRKPDDEIARTKQALVNDKALAYLAETDWMVTRFAETGVVIPDDVKAARQAARDAIVKVQP